MRVHVAATFRVDDLNGIVKIKLNLLNYNHSISGIFYDTQFDSTGPV